MANLSRTHPYVDDLGGMGRERRNRRVAVRAEEHYAVVVDALRPPVAARRLGSQGGPAAAAAAAAVAAAAGLSLTLALTLAAIHEAPTAGAGAVRILVLVLAAHLIEHLSWRVAPHTIDRPVAEQARVLKGDLARRLLGHVDLVLLQAVRRFLPRRLSLLALLPFLALPLMGWKGKREKGGGRWRGGRTAGGDGVGC